MLLWLRKIFFYLFLLLYLGITPYLVLYALGSIYNPLEGELVKTGVVSIETFPRDSTVHVGGKRYSQKTPTIVHDLLPGSYSLRLSRKGFETWEKEIQIAPERATLLEPVVLIPKRPRDEVLSMRTYSGLIPLVDSKIFLWEDQVASSRLWKLDLFFKREDPISLDWEAKGIKVQSILSRKGSSLLAFEVLQNHKKDILFWNFEREKRPALTLSDFLQKIPDTIAWDAKNPQVLFFLEEGELMRLDLKRKILDRDLAEAIRGLGVKSGRLYLIDQQFVLYTLSAKAEGPLMLLEGEGLKKEIFSGREDAFYEIEVFRRDFFQKDLILLKGSKGSLLTNRLPHRLMENGILEILYSEHSDEEAILYRKKREIGIIRFPRDSEGLFEKGPMISPVYRGGGEIRQIFWAFRDSHILCLIHDDVFLLETRGPTPHLNRWIASVRPESSIAYVEENQTLYYLSAQEGRLIRRKLTES